MTHKRYHDQVKLEEAEASRSTSNRRSIAASRRAKPRWSRARHPEHRHLGASERPWRARRGDAIFTRAGKRTRGGQTAARFTSVRGGSGEAAVRFQLHSCSDLVSRRRGGRGSGRDGGCAAPSLRHPGRFHPVRSDPDRGRAVPPSHARCRAVGACRDHDLQARVHGLQVRPGPHRARPAHAARVGDPREPVPAPHGFRAAVAAFRAEPDSG